jgi:membrane peptidoglycan carboxypeptidase
MVIRTSPFRVPFPRRLLIRLHYDLFQIDRRVRSYVDWPPDLTTVEKLILISEDRRFFRHNGVDYRSWMRELFRAVTFRRFGGASTIDMQFVRAATGYYERSVRRKLYEMLLAYLIQHRYSKLEILRSYLGFAFFGSQIYGVTDASLVVFGKIDWDLLPAEAAIIAALLIYPRPLSPSEAWAQKVDRRAKYILSLYPRLEQRFEKLPSWKSV